MSQPSRFIFRSILYPLAVLALAACGNSPPPAGSAIAGGGNAAKCVVSGTETAPPPIRHFFVILLENKGFDQIYGPGSPAAYLRDTLVPQGQLLTQFYGTVHNSTGNYISLISGQGPNADIQGDCIVFTEFARAATVDYAQAAGAGCVFPADVPTIADELETAGLSWKGYMEDMAQEKDGDPNRDPSRPAGACIGPATNSFDQTNGSDETEQYATRHNPFLFFHSIIDDAARCDAHDVDLEALRTDLASVATTPNYSFIVPDNCRNAHDSSCADGGEGGLARADEFLQEWVPLITNSPAFKQDGLLVIVFDEGDISDTAAESFAACCGEAENPGPNSASPGIAGPGGGRVGALVLSRYTTPGSVNNTPYNHYSLLRSVETMFGLQTIDLDGNDDGYLGFAGLDHSEMKGFGEDVYSCGG